jgi:hypothetical protein
VGFTLMATGVVLVAAAGLAPAWAGVTLANTERTTLTATGRTIQLEPSSSANGSATDSVDFRITGPTPQIIDVEILDIVVDSSGTRSLFPAGSTPHTLQGVMRLGLFDTRYVPDGNTQNFSVDVTSSSVSDDVRYGGVRVTITPDSSLVSGSTVDTVSGVMLMVLVIPEGFDGVLPEAGATTFSMSPLRVSPSGGQNIFERILPDIPGVVNRGPVTIDVDLTNESKNPFFLATEWVISSGEEVLLTTSSAQTVVFAEQETHEQVETVFDIPGSTSAVNLLPAFGLVDVHIKSEARLGQGLLDTTGQSTSFLVLRWKEPFAGVLALAIVWFLMWSTRRTAPDKKRSTASHG